MAKTIIDKLELMIDDLVFDREMSGKGVLFRRENLDELISILIDAREEIEKLQSVKKQWGTTWISRLRLKTNPLSLTCFAQAQWHST
nr:hypothetical protein [Providencia rettgeri]